QQRTDSLNLLSELSFAGAAYRIPPKVLKPIGRKLRITDRMLDVRVPSKLRWLECRGRRSLAHSRVGLQRECLSRHLGKVVLSASKIIGSAPAAPCRFFFVIVPALSVWRRFRARGGHTLSKRADPGGNCRHARHQCYDVSSLAQDAGAGVAADAWRNGPRFRS